MNKINPFEITPEHVYFSRRDFLVGTGALVASFLLFSGCGRLNFISESGRDDFCGSAKASRNTDELGDSLTDCESIISYNNFYEFSLEKEGIGELAKGLKTSSWTISVGGLVNKPQTFDIDDLTRKFPPEERIYRLRCVEGWSMVIPWLGFPLTKLLKEVEPKSKKEETIHHPQKSSRF